MHANADSQQADDLPIKFRPQYRVWCRDARNNLQKNNTFSTNSISVSGVPTTKYFEF